MPKEPSFDIVCEIDLQEVDNIVNQASKEIQLRYDFKNSKSSYELNKQERKITLLAADRMKLTSMQDILRQKAIKRNISPKAFQFQKEEEAFSGMIRQQVNIEQGISKDNAKKITKDIKDLKLKVQSSIQGEQLRVTGKKIDDLQRVMSSLKDNDYEFPIEFTNFRR